MKNIKKFMASFALVAMVLFMTSVCSALTIIFNRQYVSGTAFTLVCSGTKSSTSSTAELNIADILTEEGATSNYRKVRARMSSIGTEIIAEKGVDTTLSIPSRYQSAGSYVSLYCRGNNPALNCQVIGVLDIH